MKTPTKSVWLCQPYKGLNKWVNSLNSQTFSYIYSISGYSAKATYFSVFCHCFVNKSAVEKGWSSCSVCIHWFRVIAATVLWTLCLRDAFFFFKLKMQLLNCKTEWFLLWHHHLLVIENKSLNLFFVLAIQLYFVQPPFFFFITKGWCEYRCQTIWEPEVPCGFLTTP